jgi:DUF1365 family protein
VTVPAPAMVQARVHHRRSRPFTYELSHGTTMWLVDIADPNAAFPRWIRPLLSIEPTDHFAKDDHRPLPAKVRGYLEAQDVPWSADRVLMLANARSLGYVFDPLTTFFCFDAEGGLEGILAEVHNTYGERHCYPLTVTESPTMSVDKEFYVSPFLSVEGRYDIRVRLTDTDVAVAINLSQQDRTVFSARVHGDLRPATPRRTLEAVARNPLPSQRVSVLIRWHGIRLWLRRLPVIPRRPHQAPKGVA